MPTSIFQNNLEIFLEADSLSGGDGTPLATWDGLDQNNRDFDGIAPLPTIKTNAVNGKKSVNWDGTKNPLVFNGGVTVRCGFMVAKTVSAPSVYGGLLTSPVNYTILVTDQGTDNFFDVGYDWYEYRLNDRIFSPVRSWANGDYVKVLTAPAPAGAWGIIYFKFWNSLPVLGLQIGQQTNFTARKLNAEVALLAIYSEDLCEEKIRKMFQSLAYSYQIGIADVFPFPGSRGDVRGFEREVLTDSQKEPNLRVRDAAERQDFDAQFALRNITELNKVRAFRNSFYPAGSFLVRDYNCLPPEDTLARFAIPSRLELAENLNLSNYQIRFTESSGTLNYTIPAAAPDISE